MLQLVLGGAAYDPLVCKPISILDSVWSGGQGLLYDISTFTVLYILFHMYILSKHAH